MNIAHPNKETTQSSRSTDPNVLQRQASKPDDSVWVSASAGSGKTKVLTERILRLLLPDKDGYNSTSPHKILALTFTKAGASEMALRIRKKLSDWAVLNHDDLTKDLKELNGHHATPTQLKAARKLFTNVVDAPDGLKIMTIHSFCQSLLGRFPLEACIDPNFKPLTEKESKTFIQASIQKILQESGIDKGSPYDSAVQNLSILCNQDQIYELINKLLSERKQFQNILEKNFGVDGLYTALCQEFDIPAGETREDLILKASKEENFCEKDLYDACKILSESKGKTDIKKALSIQLWLEADHKNKILLFDDYKNNFLKKEGEIFKKLATKTLTDKNANILNILETEALRLFTLEQKINAITTATATKDLFLIGEKVYDVYSDYKEKQGLLDFDDLILKCLDLLKGNTPKLKGLDTTPWVRFKLDQGIDHILLDEAQDTNPEQWELIETLCEDFFNGESSSDTNRTLFVVGDEKQSIYSFQRASPEKFSEMHQYFESKIKQSKKEFNFINFNTSFRSTKPVLELVDAVFSNTKTKKGLGLNAVAHESHRKLQAGLIELWPLFENSEKQETDSWKPPLDIIESSSGASQMASYIGETISSWIKNKEPLETHNRPIEAGDIMILVRSRTAFLDQLVRALKTRNIPVSGIDRMVLSDQLVIQDLCAAAQFCLLPEDDLSLAGLLKSPFIGWDEDQLFKCAYKRTGTLWQSVKNSDDLNTISWLTNLIEFSGKLQPYEFFMRLLQTPCPKDKVSGLRALKKRLGNEILDPLEEFLNITLDKNSSSISTLQTFIQEQINNETQIKRQMEEAGQAVRIMTVHAAKGLQAPIVILPDTARTANSFKSEKLLWPNKTGDKLPYFCPTSKKAPKICQDSINALQEKDNEEYRRLLYVALTRAENRLYIGGYKASKDLIEDSWYRYVEKGFNELENVISLQKDTFHIRRYKQQATDKPDRVDTKQKINKINDVTVPDWLFNPVESEIDKSKTVQPSRILEEDTPVSPLINSNKKRFIRGDITHKLLQFLPDMPEHKWQESAEIFVSQPMYDLPKNIQSSVVNEIIQLLTKSEFKEIFGPNSFAEVPITGTIENNIKVSGQIDRLLVKDKEIFIIDYKTNRQPPANKEKIPIIYKNQMQIYAKVLCKIYPNHKIRTGLLWTDGPILMELDNI